MQNDVYAIQKYSQSSRFRRRHGRNVLRQDGVKAAQVSAQLGLVGRQGQVRDPSIFGQGTRDLSKEGAHRVGLLL